MSRAAADRARLPTAHGGGLNELSSTVSGFRVKLNTEHVKATPSDAIFTPSVVSENTVLLLYRILPLEGAQPNYCPIYDQISG